MRSIQKISLSLLVAVVTFSAFAFFAFSGLFDALETSFYSPRVLQQYRTLLDDSVETIDRYNQANLDRFESIIDQPEMRSVFRANQSRADIQTREQIFSRVSQTQSGFGFARVVDRDGERLHFSTLSDDYETDGEERVYLPLEEIDDDPGRLALGSGESGDVVVRPDKHQLVYRLPIADENDIRQGTALFYFSPRSLTGELVSATLVDSGRDVVLIGEQGFLLNVPRASRESVRGAAEEVWDGIEPGGTGNISGEIDFVLPLTEVNGVRAAYFVPADELSLGTPLQAILLGGAFLTVFLLVFLLMNIRQDSTVVLSERVKRFQINMLREYLERREEVDWESRKRELERRKPEMIRRIKRGIGKVRPDEREKLDELVEKGWDEIIDVIGSRGASGRSNIDLQQLESMLERVVGSLGDRPPDRPGLAAPANAVGQYEGQSAQYEAQSASKRSTSEYSPTAGNAESLAAPAYGGEVPSEAEAIEEDELEEIGATEEVEDLGEAEALEEMEAAEEGELPGEVEDLEELESSEGVEAAEEGESPEAVEALEEMEAAEESESPGEVEDLEELESSEGVEAAEDVSALSETEEVAELEEVSELESVDDGVEESEDRSEATRPERRKGVSGDVGEFSQRQGRRGLIQKAGHFTDAARDDPARVFMNASIEDEIDAIFGSDIPEHGEGGKVQRQRVHAGDEPAQEVEETHNIPGGTTINQQDLKRIFGEPAIVSRNDGVLTIDESVYAGNREEYTSSLQHEAGKSFARDSSESREPVGVTSQEEEVLYLGEVPLEPVSRARRRGGYRTSREPQASARQSPTAADYTAASSATDEQSIVSSSGIDFDRFLRRFRSDDVGVVRALVFFTRRVSANLAFILVKTDEGFRGEFSLGIEEGAVRSISVPGDTDLAEKILDKRNVFMFERPLAELEGLRFTIDERAFSSFKRSLFLPVTFRHKQAYLVLGLESGGDDAETVLKRIKTVLKES